MRPLPLPAIILDVRLTDHVLDERDRRDSIRGINIINVQQQRFQSFPKSRKVAVEYRSDDGVSIRLVALAYDLLDWILKLRRCVWSIALQRRGKTLKVRQISPGVVGVSGSLACGLASKYKKWHQQ